MARYAYLAVYSSNVGSGVIFAETATGYWGYSNSSSTQTICNCTGNTLRAACIPTTNGYYCSGWTSSGYSVDSATDSLISFTANKGSVVYGKIGGGASVAGPAVTIIDAHGTHSGTPTGANMHFKASHVIGVRHLTTNSGYTFRGWKVTLFNTSGAAGTILSSGGTTSSNVTTFPASYDYAIVVKTASSNVYPITIEALYEASTYTIAYNANGGSGAPGSQTATVGSSVTLSSTAPTRPYKTFLGWSMSSTATSATYVAGGTYSSLSPTAGSTVNLYAVWADITFTLTFDPNGGSVSPTSKTVTAGSTYGALPTPTYDSSHTFVGWFTATVGGTQITATTTADRTSAQTVYAHWTTAYTLSYDPNGGTGAPSAQTFESSVTLSSAVPTFTYRTFLGWALSSSATAAAYQPGGTYTFGGNTVLYAIWATIGVTLTFNANGGSVSPASKTVTAGASYGTLPVPTRSGYVCSGWYTASSGGTAVTSSTVVTNTSNHTLYAQWMTASSHLTIQPRGHFPEFNTPIITLGSFMGSRSSTGYPAKPSPITGLPDDVIVVPSEDYIACSGFGSAAAGEVCNPDSLILLDSLYSGWEGMPVTASGMCGNSEVSVDEYSDDFLHIGYYGGEVVYTPDYINLVFLTDALSNAGLKPYGWITGYREVSGGAVSGSYWNPITNLSLTTGNSLNLSGDFLHGIGWKVAGMIIPLCRKIDYIVTFNPNGGVITSGTYFKRVYRDAAYGTLPMPTRTGYTFAGW